MTDVLCLGEALIDRVSRAGEAPSDHVGGSIFNVAAGLARLGHDTSLATWIGRDAAGATIAAAAAAAGVRLVPGSDGAASTPLALAEIDDEGKASYVFDVSWQVPDVVEAAVHLHIGSYSATLDPGAGQVAEVVRLHREGGASTISYDPNVRPALMGTADEVRPRIEGLVALCDVVKASDDDLAWLYPGRPWREVLEGWIGSGVGLAVMTRGSEGAVALGASGQVHEVAPRRVTLGDTVGAGDSFMAGLLSGLLDARLLGGQGAGTRLREAAGVGIGDALSRATLTSALTVERIGAHAPTRADLDGGVGTSVEKE